MSHLEAAFIGISRHRIGVDGNGVTTLACFHGCSLRCRYCLNAQCLGPDDGMRRHTPESLYQYCLIDNLYFVATGGGVCFGGGEPLLRSEFLVHFRELCGKSWQLTVESALSVPRKAVETAATVIDQFIIDIKDCNNDIYKRYTGKSNRQSMSNLKWLLETVGAKRIIVRVPLIKGYNTKADTDRSVEQLKAMGVENLDRFEYRLPQEQPTATKTTKKNTISKRRITPSE